MRPSTSSGGRPQTSSGRSNSISSIPVKVDGFIVRVRTAAGTFRCVLTDENARVQDLRDSIASTCQIQPEYQSLTRARRPWFEAAAAASNSQHPQYRADDFPLPDATMKACKIQHGDMLFVESTQPASSENEPANEQADNTPASFSSQLQPELIRGDSQSLAYRASDLDEDGLSLQPSAALPTGSLSSALQLLSSMRSDLVASSDQPQSLLQRFDELQRLLSASTLASSTSVAPFDDAASHHARTDSTQTQAADLSSLSSFHATDSIPTPTASAVITSIDSTSTVEYWHDRYTRLRTKAEKMNIAGLNLKQSFDTAQLEHERLVNVLRGRVKRREERIHTLETMLQTFTTKIPTPPQTASGPRRPVHHSTVSTASITTQNEFAAPLTSSDDAPIRRVRPDSASRYRRPPSAIPSSSQQQIDSSSAALQPQQLQRPPSRSSRHQDDSKEDNSASEEAQYEMRKVKRTSFGSDVAPIQSTPTRSIVLDASKQQHERKRTNSTSSRMRPE